MDRTLTPFRGEEPAAYRRRLWQAISSGKLTLDQLANCKLTGNVISPTLQVLHNARRWARREIARQIAA